MSPPQESQVRQSRKTLHQAHDDGRQGQTRRIASQQPRGATAEELAAQAEFWRSMYERERARLTKLWVAFQDAEAELEDLRAEDGRPEHAPPPRTAPATPVSLDGSTSVRPTVIATNVFWEPGQKPEPKEPYRLGEYTLYRQLVHLKNDRNQEIFYFARKPTKKGTPSPVPDGYEVSVSSRTGLPLLRHIGHRAEEKKSYQPQCAAITGEGDQCRNSSRDGSRYCASHRGYHPKGASAFMSTLDTAPRVATAVDTRPAVRGEAEATPAHGPGSASAEHARRQCEAVGANGLQCRNLQGAGSKYCASHHGYQPKSIAALVEAHDTKPRVRAAADTRPAIRSTASGRGR